MNVLVAGAAGFLGSHLLDRLLSDGHHVIGVDNLSTGSLENIRRLSGVSVFDFIECDVEGLDYSFKNLDLIVHLASPASPKYFGQIPLEIASANSNGTSNLLEIARENSARFLFASTSECYGDPQVHPQPETYNGNVNPVSVRGIYHESKRFGETLTMAHHRVYGIDTRIARIFNTYGPRIHGDDGRVISNFLSQAIEGGGITVYGDGSQTRSFCYVSDMVEGLIRLAYHQQVADIHLPINLGNPQELTILDLAKKVLDITSSESDILFEDRPDGDPSIRCPDISKANDILKWNPSVNINDGLLKTLRFLRDGN